MNLLSIFSSFPSWKTNLRSHVNHSVSSTNQKKSVAHPSEESSVNSISYSSSFLNEVFIHVDEFLEEERRFKSELGLPVPIDKDYPIGFTFTSDDMGIVSTQDHNGNKLGAFDSENYDIPDEFISTSHFTLMSDPVITTAKGCLNKNRKGHTFEREVLEDWLSSRNSDCPQCRTPLRNGVDYQENTVLKDDIHKFVFDTLFKSIESQFTQLTAMPIRDLLQETSIDSVLSTFMRKKILILAINERDELVEIRQLLQEFHSFRSAPPISTDILDILSEPSYPDQIKTLAGKTRRHMSVFLRLIKMPVEQLLREPLIDFELSPEVIKNIVCLAINQQILDSDLDTEDYLKLFKDYVVFPQLIKDILLSELTVKVAALDTVEIFQLLNKYSSFHIDVIYILRECLCTKDPESLLVFSDRCSCLPFHTSRNERLKKVLNKDCLTEGDQKKLFALIKDLKIH